MTLPEDCRTGGGGPVAEAYTLLYGEYITLSGKTDPGDGAWQASLLGF